MVMHGLAGSEKWMTFSGSKLIFYKQFGALCTAARGRVGRDEQCSLESRKEERKEFR